MENQPNLLNPINQPTAHIHKFHGTLILAVALASISGYFALANQLSLWPFEEPLTFVASTPTPRPSPVATPDPTAGWQTYHNDEYGFEFKYPHDWVRDGETETIYSPDAPRGIYGVNDRIKIYTYSNSIELSLKDWWEKNKTDITISDKGTVPIEGAVSHQYVEGGMTNVINTYISKGKIIVRLQAEEDSKYLNIYDQILSTFHFTK